MIIRGDKKLLIELIKKAIEEQSIKCPLVKDEKLSNKAA